MKGLVQFLIESVATHPDSIEIEVIEGEASVLLEARVHDEDRERLEADDARLLRAMQTLLTVAGGPQKPVLELVGGADDDSSSVAAVDAADEAHEGQPA